MAVMHRARRITLATAGLMFVALLSGLSTIQPMIAFGVIGGTIAFALAYRSAAIPLGVTSAILFFVVIGARLPQGGTTVLVTLWLALAIVLGLSRDDPDRAPLRAGIDSSAIALGLLGVLVLVGTASSLDPSYGSTKAQLFIVEGLLPFAAGLVVALGRRTLILFLRLYAIGGVLTSIYGVYLLVAGGAAEANQNRFTISQQVNPIGFARSMAETLLILVVLMVDARTRSTRLLLGVAAIPVVIAMLGAGSRGPSIGLVAAVVALLASRRGTGPAFRRLVGVLLATFALGTVAVLLVVPPATTQRALSIFTGKDESGDSATRFQLWSQAIDYLPGNPIRLATGVGTGSFAALSPDQDYPHNIALETLLEQGVIGFLALVIFLVVTFRKSWRLARLPGDDGAIGSLVFALVVFAVTAAMFSGDIAANGSVFLWSGVIAGLVARARATPAAVAAAPAAGEEPEPPFGALAPTPEGA